MSERRESSELTPDPSAELTAESLRKRFPHRFETPRIHPSAILLPGAQVHGDVVIGADSSIWCNSVIRGDVNYVRIGERTNVQDLSLVHVSYQASPTILGNDVTIGHAVVLHACTVKDFALIGMGSILLDDVEIGELSLIGAGSLVTQGTKIPPGVKAFGRPCKVVGELTEAEKDRLRHSAAHYVRLSKTYC